MTDWKTEHANESGKALKHPRVEHVIDELMGNLRTDDALVRYGITKVAMVAAQVARAQCLGFDPDLLKMTEEEGNLAMIRRARQMMDAGVPTVLVVAPDDKQ
jgi:stalled ribosome rescue protein Dom34